MYSPYGNYMRLIWLMLLSCLFVRHGDTASRWLAHLSTRTRNRGKHVALLGSALVAEWFQHMPQECPRINSDCGPVLYVITVSLLSFPVCLFCFCLNSHFYWNDNSPFYKRVMCWALSCLWAVHCRRLRLPAKLWSNIILLRSNKQDVTC